MVNFAHSLTLRETLRLESYTLCKKMQTFTCITLRLNGVLSTKNIIKLSAIMLIIGKILEESPIFLTTKLTSSVKIGKQVLS